jgi:hypothetical protein
MDYETALKHFLDAANWARDNCPSFQGSEVVDVSDVSLAYDQIAEYVFTDVKDSNWFRLRWQ